MSHAGRAARFAAGRFPVGGGLAVRAAESSDRADHRTAGAFLLFSDVMDKGKSTPLHTHPSDESHYVVDGEILVHLDGQEQVLAAGGLAIAPRAIPHAFLVLSDTATILTLHTPGTCQAFYLGASEPLTPDTRRVVDFDRVRASALANGGIEILGPPPFPPR